MHKLSFAQEVYDIRNGFPRPASETRKANMSHVLRTSSLDGLVMFTDSQQWKHPNTQLVPNPSVKVLCPPLPMCLWPIKYG